MSKSAAAKKVITIKQAIDSLLLSGKVEGKSYGTIECYADKLKGFLWYATNYHWPDDVTAITTDHLQQFLAYLRESPHRFNSTCPRTMKPINSTTIQKYYRALSALFNWSINEGTLETNALVKIEVPRAEKKVVKVLDSPGVNQLISSLPKPAIETPKRKGRWVGWADVSPATQGSMVGETRLANGNR